MKQIISVLILSAILFGCKKSSEEDEYYTIKGLVLDFDSKLPIANAKVIQYEFCCGQKKVDSLVSDVNGMVSFNCKNQGDYKMIAATKDNYVHPLKYVNYQVLAHISRTDTVYLARPSFLQLTIHKANIYQSADSIKIYVSGDYYAATSGHTSNFRTLVIDKANSPDKVFNLYTFYELPDYNKLNFHYQITRNGILISDQYLSSTNLIQFGTQNFIINY